MSHTRYLKALFNDLCSGWKPFELFWLVAFLAAQIWAYWRQPDSWVSMVAGISGIICVVLVSKGKMINYLFGLILPTVIFTPRGKPTFWAK